MFVSPVTRLEGLALWGRSRLPDGFDHAEAHFHAAVGVVLAGLRKSGHAVVAVPQDLDAETVMLLEGTDGEERTQSAGGSALQSCLEGGKQGQVVCTLGQGPTFALYLRYLPRE